MANNYFRFKHFTVCQERTAMKVGTDGVLLGAWVPLDGALSVLDIGTGTGLIALMLAQRSCDTHIDAIELDELACKQASDNFTASPWGRRLNVICSDFQSYTSVKKYDLIVSNPPYFNNALKNDCHQKSMARHTDSLSFAELLKGSAELLNFTGRFCVILPYDERDNFQQLASEYKLILNRVLRVRPKPTGPVKRVLLEFSFQNSLLDEQEIIIEEFGRHQYSEAYMQLTRDFYLAF